jgi:hypothetical protein
LPISYPKLVDEEINARSSSTALMVRDAKSPTLVREMLPPPAREASPLAR